MSYFSIDGYQPQWRTDPQAVATEHGPVLRALAGRTLRRAWLCWDITDDEWFADLSITWNTIDPHCAPARTDGEFHSSWREAAA